jgi:hypothetical protein
MLSVQDHTPKRSNGGRGAPEAFKDCSSYGVAYLAVAALVCLRLHVGGSCGETAARLGQISWSMRHNHRRPTTANC